MTGAKRAEALPDVPTVAEAALHGYEASNWYGMIAPAGTPPEAVQRLNREITAALKSADVVSQLRDMGIDPTPTSPAEFARHIAAEQKRWGPIIRKSNIKVD